MLIKLYPDNPNPKQIAQVVETLRKGGLIIYPTDTIYGIGCDIFNARAVETICRIKKIDPRKVNLSFICYDLSHISEYAKVPDKIFKMMKKNLPGPFTFILEGNNKLPKLFKTKKTVGIRVPNNSIVREIVNELGNPILSTSIKNDDEVLEYFTDPELIYERYKDQTDIVIDGGYGDIEPSTVVDCTGDEIEIVRQGKGTLLY